MDVFIVSILIYAVILAGRRLFQDKRETKKILADWPTGELAIDHAPKFRIQKEEDEPIHELY